MRNLQKILALALALIMSFSLVVTANAAFSDEADITDTYNEAVNVLSQLEVFKGYTDGTYQPQKSITRAEVAAIIYRIATGDVTDAQVSIYSDWNRFTDVHAGEWWAGYINYCANAEYIKGYGNGKFGPDDPVTGYEALAMILRAVGYGKMEGEFQGSDWAVQTAARANTLKVTKNVQNSALLNSAATRELVAELLFRSILVPTVEYNQFSGYSENDTTLAYQSFGLERVEGVVVANEYADLYSTQVLNEGKTNLQEANGTIRSLDIGSVLTDVGESRYAYIIDSTRGAKVLGLEDTGSNNVWEPENGKGTKVNDGLKAASVKKNDDTEFYINFGREGHFSCDQRLEFTVVFYNATAEESFDKAYKDISEYAYKQNTTGGPDDEWTVRWDSDGDKKITNADKEIPESRNDRYENIPVSAAAVGNTDAIPGYPVAYNRVIRANEEITQEEMDILEGIFAAADNKIDETTGRPKDQVTGDVFVGTKSTNSQTDEERDVSNSISFRKFKDEYINSEAWDQDIDKSDNGEWLKIVDHNNDGIADYVFLTEYTLDKAISSYTKSGETILEFNSVDVEAFEDNDGIIDIPEDVAVGTVVYYTKIDNRITMTVAPMATAKIKTVNFKDESCTTTEDVTYVESGIFNKSRLDQEVENLDDEVEYNLYFDAYGYLRAYELAQGNTYGLLTELYKTTTQNAQYVKGVDLTVELKKGSAAIDEFDVSNSKDNVFLLDGIASKENDNNWNTLNTAVAALAKANNWIYKNVYNVDKDFSILLQPAIGQLGLEYEGDARSAANIFRNVTTNVATYIETGDGEVRLTSPVKYATNEKGSRLYYSNKELTGGKYVKGEEVNGVKVTEDYPAYEVDYIALDLSKGLEADARRYDISAQSRYIDQSGKYVNAVHDTEYYVVNTNTKKADYFTDYENVYAISKDHIISAYAVARNTVADHGSNDYWVADVIVIEVSGLDTIFDSVAMLYTNPSQTSGSVKLLKTLNSESTDPAIDMIPEDWEWASQRDGNWVYEVDEKEIKDGVLYADAIQPFYASYNAKGVYAGIVSHVKETSSRGGYIDVVMPSYNNAKLPVPAKAASDVADWVDSVTVTNDQLFAIITNRADERNCTTRDLRVTESATTDRVKVGDRIIWVEDKAGHTAFVIDIDFVDGDWKAPSWLTSTGTVADKNTAGGLWYSIAVEQVSIKGATTFKEAMDAYNTWVQDKTEANRTKAVDAVTAALKNPKLTDEEKARLEDILDILNKAGTPDPEKPGTSANSLTVKNAADLSTYFDTNSNEYTATGRKLKMTISDAGSLEDYISAFAIPAGAEVDWTFTITGGREYAVTSTSAQWNKNDANVGTIRISDLTKVKAILKLADGTTQEYNSDTTNWIDIKVGANIQVAPSKDATTWSTKGTDIKAPAGAVLYFKNCSGNDADKESRGGTFYGVTDGWKSYATGAGATTTAAATSNTGYTVSGKDSITFVKYPEVTLAKDGSSNNVTLPATVKTILKNGETSCTFTVKVNNGYQITADNGAAVARGKAVTGGYEWTVTKTGVVDDVTITVTEATAPKIVVNVPADGKIAMVNGTLPNANVVNVVMEGEQTSGTLTLLVETGLKPKITAGDANIFTTSFEKKEAVGVNTKWEISYTGVTTDKTVTLGTEAETSAPAPSKPDFDNSKITKDKKEPITASSTRASITLEGETTSNLDFWGSNGYDQAVSDPDEPVAFYLWNIRDVIPADVVTGWGLTVTSWEMEVNNPAYAVIYPSGYPHGSTYTTTIADDFTDPEMATVLKAGSTVTMKFTPVTSAGAQTSKTITVVLDATGLTIVE